MAAILEHTGSAISIVISRLHPNLKITRILTGRLATEGFPVLGLPKHTDEGKRVRKALRAEKGWVIFSADYSQIELRVAAELSGDPGLIEAFKRGEDIHAAVAHRVLGAPKRKEDQDESKHRLPAKAANFGYWMGLSEKGLTEQVHKAGVLTWSAGCPGCKFYKAEHDPGCDSVRFFREYNAQYPLALRYQEDRINHARKTGMAFDLWGRNWYLPGVWAEDELVRTGTERQTFALPIQSTAQGIIKQAMKQIRQQDLPKFRTSVRPILQVHDELLFEVRKDQIAAWGRTVQHSMETVVKFQVPILAEWKVGPSWGEVAKFNG